MSLGFDIWLRVNLSLVLLKLLKTQSHLYFFVGGEEKVLNQRQIGAAMLLQKYTSLLSAHIGEILPVASSLATNGPRYNFAPFCFVFKVAPCFDEVPLENLIALH